MFRTFCCPLLSPRTTLSSLLHPRCRPFPLACCSSARFLTLPSCFPSFVSLLLSATPIASPLPLPFHFRSFSIDATRNYAGRTHEEYTIAYRVLLLRECITRVMCVKYETTRACEFIKRQSRRTDLQSFLDGNLHTEKILEISLS